MAVPDEGYVKFQAVWEQAAPLPAPKLAELSHWRDEMHRLHLIGVYENGIGFGNISQRSSGNQFIITGTATGHLPTLTSAHFTTVTNFDIEKNTVHCRGPALASSEAMSHAVIYRECPEVQGVIHVHNAELWERLLDQVPTTADGATYGSPEMALSIINLLKNSDLRQQKIFVMRNHPEGIFVFGASLAKASAVLMHHLDVT
ncbi:MAG: class II aldolase/adducin family protein [Saprospiraceae bacterium]|nr:class II aldolase/adducin family protein [Saprospiraceae bacterium]MCF8249099.1 class II aldolase/adducin family protein [Saprospiraceae bacterium]MCF8282904.1 class II aldolase/adducin family protein [Bacteroidales bacterium]MCF8311121.1 class II aldolase/adducin family protein [Saprospiraceae bacterium]MCF8440211.1 class II aldolase/adducin family protein [Saprospiraceae bacterium]